MKGPMTPFRPVGIKLYVRDVEASIAFYRAALDLRWIPDIWSFQFGEFPRDEFFLLSLLESTDDDPRPIGGAHWSYVVDDVDAVHRRALAAGAREWYPPQDNQGSPRSSGFEDPDGNRVELWKA